MELTAGLETTDLHVLLKSISLKKQSSYRTFPSHATYAKSKPY